LNEDIPRLIVGYLAGITQFHYTTRFYSWGYLYRQPFPFSGQHFLCPLRGFFSSNGKFIANILMLGALRLAKQLI
jgi:hypothetical protein